MQDQRISELYNRLKKQSDTFLGYPLAKDFSFNAFAPFLDLCINNVGDPESVATLAIDTKDFENECIDFFINILSGDRNTVWGYITNGGTESNLYGLYVARESFPNAIVYYSESTHYSVRKNLHLLNLPNIIIRSQENGEMDYDDLESTLSLRRDKPAIFFLNIGTTMTEAVDQLDEIKKIIRKLAIKDYYIHCDAAFLGAIAPFIEPKLKFDFAEGVDSIAISGHKFLGSPIPCGIVLVRRRHRDRITNSVAYVGTLDTTITGSRNGLTPLFIWWLIKTLGKNGLVERAKKAQALAAYTEKRLNEAGIAAWRNGHGLTVVLPKPSDAICAKYQLASEGEIAHIICVPGIRYSQIDEFVDELQAQEQAKNQVSLASTLVL